MLTTRFASSPAVYKSPKPANQPLFAGRKEDMAKAEQECRRIGINPQAVKDTVVIQPPINTSHTSLRKLQDPDVSVRRREQNRLAQEHYRNRQKAQLAALKEAVKHPGRFFQTQQPGDTIFVASSAAANQHPAEGSDIDAPFEWDDEYMPPTTQSAPMAAPEPPHRLPSMDPPCSHAGWTNSK